MFKIKDNFENVAIGVRVIPHMLQVDVDLIKQTIENMKYADEYESCYHKGRWYVSYSTIYSWSPIAKIYAIRLRICVEYDVIENNNIKSDHEIVSEIDLPLHDLPRHILEKTKSFLDKRGGEITLTEVQMRKLSELEKIFIKLELEL